MFVEVLGLTYTFALINILPLNMTLFDHQGQLMVLISIYSSQKDQYSLVF